MPTRIHNETGQVLYGITGQFKYNPALDTARRRRSHVIHLAVHAKPDMVTVIGKFKAAHDGTMAEVGEFNYESPSKYLRITNIEHCSGLSLESSSELDYAIPLTAIARSQIILTNIYAPEQIIATGV